MVEFTENNEVQPVCSCSTKYCYTIKKESYEKYPYFWDTWQCKNCNPDAYGSLKRYIKACKDHGVDPTAKMITPPRHTEACKLEDRTVSDDERDTFAESMCTCGVYEIKKHHGWAN